MSPAFLLSIRFHDGRYHGRPEWPPSPARLFQALVAAASSGGTLRGEDRDALFWLERLDPPVIAAPVVRVGTGLRNYVPNNDLDAVGGDPRRVAEIRTAKFIKPLLFDSHVPVLYAWQFEKGEERARRLCAISERLYQLGRGVDMAWAWGEIVEAVGLDDRLAQHGGPVYRPSNRGRGRQLLCPRPGSLCSLDRRFEAMGKRISTIKSGHNGQQLFSQPPRPRFTLVAYDSPPRRFFFEIRESVANSAFAPWPLTAVSALVENLRDRAAQRLKGALPKQAATVDRVFIGREATDADKAARIRIVPLPSIGSPHVERSIRRVVVEVPPNCPLQSDDIAWAFSNVSVSNQVDHETGEIVSETNLVPTDDFRMLEHYGIKNGGKPDGARVWRTVTPTALPLQAARRRIDPGRLNAELKAARRKMGALFEEVKSNTERLDEEGRAAAAIVQALRHIGVPVRLEKILVQREPFEGRGVRAEAFGKGTRFAKERLWHAEIAFVEPVIGPLVIGDGRYLGLGIMAPHDACREMLVFAVPQAVKIAAADTPALVRATRRALMALSREATGRVPRLFSGHETNGEQAASGHHEHVFIAADESNGDGYVDRLIVASPWVCDRTAWTYHWQRKLFDDVASRLENVRAGPLGCIRLGPPRTLDDGDPLIGPARIWESRTPYLATRHAGRRADIAAALIRDVRAECSRRGFPVPVRVELLEVMGLPNGGGLKARARLGFATVVRGPLLLGRDSHRGGGLFSVCAEGGIDARSAASGTVTAVVI